MAELALLLDVTQVSYSPTSPPALADIRLALAAGDSAVILGANGSGKTTLLLTLAGAIPHLGRYHGAQLDGRLDWITNVAIAVDSASVHRYWQDCGVVFQYPDHNFVTTTVLDELLLAARVAGISQSEAKRRIADAVGRLGLAKNLNRCVDELSDGTKQLVALCSMVIRRPRYLFLDEPTAMLDSDNCRNVVDGLQAYRAAVPNAIIVITTHDPAIFDKLTVNRVLVVSDRRVVEMESVQKAVGLLDRGPEIGIDNSSSDDSYKLVAAELLSPYYRADTDLLPASGLTFGLSQGEITLIVGANASGKTTLCRTLAGVHRTYQGTLMFRGRSYRSRLPAAPTEVGLVPQIPTTHFISDTVRGEILLSGSMHLSPEEVLAVAEPFLQAFNVALDADPLMLSFGQQKLVSLLTYLNVPDLLLVDEPVTCLDSNQRESALRLLQWYLERGTALAVTTHQETTFARFRPHVVEVSKISGMRPPTA